MACSHVVHNIGFEGFACGLIPNNDIDDASDSNDDAERAAENAF
jgi:hypothetical protein